MRVVLIFIFVLATLVSCVYSTKSPPINYDKLSKKIALESEISIEDGKVRPSKTFKLTQSGRYSVWVELFIQDEKGIYNSVRVAESFTGYIDITEQDGSIFKTIRVNIPSEDLPLKKLGTDVVVLRKGFSDKTLSLRGENLSVPAECQIGKCRIIVTLNKFSFQEI